ncbi:MAG: helix-turn-helix domain-containing protein [Muribaculaceae bacterium]|nr:helix-turn-helix domain-containing protein [Muribaculaceae bacterium]
MKRVKTSQRELLGDITPEERAEARLSFQISNRLDFLMQEKGLSKKQLADAIGKRPSEITRWLSGEHNFTNLNTCHAVLILRPADYNNRIACPGYEYNELCNNSLDYFLPKSVKLSRVRCRY